MPPGSKKRRAAKKKKGLEGFKNLSTNNPQGNDDVKSQDGKESDGGEVSSPLSRDQDSDQNSLNERNEELEERDPSSIRSFVAEDKSVEDVCSDVEDFQKASSEYDGVVKIERELESEESSESKNGSIEHVESTKEPNNGDDRSSSSSSSDDESRVTEKKPKEYAYKLVLEASSCDDLVKPVDPSPAEVTWVTENVPVGETVNSIAESAQLVDSVKPVVSVSEETIHIPESAPVENLVIADVVESGLKEIEEKLLPKTQEAPAAVTDLALKKNEDKVFPISDENVHASSIVVESVSTEYEGKVLPSSSAPVAATGNGAVTVTDLELKKNDDKVFPMSDESVNASSIVVESVSTEYEGKIWAASSAPVAATGNGAVTVTDLELKKNDDKLFPMSDESVSASSIVVESVSTEYEGKILPSSSAPVAATGNGAANVKHSEIPECSENQPLIAPRVVQKTSWLSCCGLLDVLTGSGR